MAARNKPAGIRSLVYGIDKAKVGIEGLSVSSPEPGWPQALTESPALDSQPEIGEPLRGTLKLLDQAEHERLFGRFLAVTDRQRLVDPHGLMADRGD